MTLTPTQVAVLKIAAKEWRRFDVLVTPRAEPVVGDVDEDGTMVVDRRLGLGCTVCAYDERGRRVVLVANVTRQVAEEAMDQIAQFQEEGDAIE